MTLTTGAILRRITEADLSSASHKLATIILDGIAFGRTATMRLSVALPRSRWRI
jgi:hypothetical protein